MKDCRSCPSIRYVNRADYGIFMHRYYGCSRLPGKLPGDDFLTLIRDELEAIYLKCELRPQ